MKKGTKRSGTVTHLAFYNDGEDIEELAGMTGAEVVEYYLDGYGNAYEETSRAEGAELERLLGLGTVVGSDGRTYIVDSTVVDGLPDGFDSTDPDCDEYVDIYLVRGGHPLA